MKPNPDLHETLLMAAQLSAIVDAGTSHVATDLQALVRERLGGLCASCGHLYEEHDPAMGCNHELLDTGGFIRCGCRGWRDPS